MAVKDWSTTAASNTGILTGITLDGSVMPVPVVDDAFREMSAQIAAQLGKLNYKGADMPSAATVALNTATGWYVDVTGSTTITSFGVVDAGQMFILRFAGAMTITHNASTLILPGATSLLTASGDTGIFVSLGAGAWRCINYFVASGGGPAPVGSIMDYAGSAAPSGWLLCYGQAVSRTTYAVLFTAIGTTYGAGDGTTFNLPDLRGRVIAGKDDMGGSSANRLTNQTGGLNGDTLGATGGAETHTLTTAQMPSHSHGVTDPTHAHSVSDPTHAHSISDPGHSHTYTQFSVSGTGIPQTGGSAGLINSTTSAVGTGIGIYAAGTGISVTAAGTGISVNAAGSGSAHNIVQPTAVLNKIIRY